MIDFLYIFGPVIAVDIVCLIMVAIESWRENH